MMGGWQIVPQVPQLFGSAARSTHRLLQSVGRVPRVQAHVRFTHCWPSTQALPQVPQLAGLVVRLTHAPAQLVSPGIVQVIWQIPAEQTDPAGHALPHMPQLAGLDRVSTQAPPHTVSPTGQVIPPSAVASRARASAGRTTSPVELWSPFTEVSSAASGSFPSTDASVDLSTVRSTTLRPPHPAPTANEYAHSPRPHSQRRLRSIFITRPICALKEDGLRAKGTKTRAGGLVTWRSYVAVAIPNGSNVALCRRRGPRNRASEARATDGPRDRAVWAVRNIL